MEKNPQLELGLICYDKDGKVIEPPKEKGPHDDLLAQMNDEVYGPPKIGRSKGWKELYPNANLSLVPETEIIIPSPPPEPAEVKRLVEKDPEEDRDEWGDQPRYR